MAKSGSPKKPDDMAKRRGGARACGDLVADISGMAFKRFGFVQGAVVSRWPEIVGERYANHSMPEAIRFPAGKKSGGTLSLVVEGAHAPLIQHLAPMIVERVNRFFGYEAIDKIVFRQGRISPPHKQIVRPTPAPVPAELGEGLRAVADDELRACLTSLASSLIGSQGAPRLDPMPPPIPTIRTE